jgi:hypothetical protein
MHQVQMETMEEAKHQMELDLGSPHQYWLVLDFSSVFYSLKSDVQCINVLSSTMNKMING